MLKKFQRQIFRLTSRIEKIFQHASIYSKSKLCADRFLMCPSSIAIIHICKSVTASPKPGTKNYEAKLQITYWENLSRFPNLTSEIPPIYFVYLMTIFIIVVCASRLLPCPSSIPVGRICNSANASSKLGMQMLEGKNR